MNSVRSPRTSSLCSLVVVLSVLCLAAPQARQEAANDGFILFTSDRANPSAAGICPNCEDVYVMAPDGSGVTRLTAGGGAPGDLDAYNSNGPEWSPRRKLVAFHSNRRVDATAAVSPRIFLMNLDGTDQRLLASLGPLGALFPSFSPNGNRVCFNSQVRPRDIYVVNVHGEDLMNLTGEPGQPGAAADELRCDWSPNGNAILFGSTRDTEPGKASNEEIYGMNQDGSRVVRLTHALGADANPAWSPAGDRIAFESNRDGNPEIYVMDVDGTGLVRLTFFAGQDSKPTWSPDGSRIAFHRRVPLPGQTTGGHLQVFTMSAHPDGVPPTQLTFTPAPGSSGFPSWSR